MAGLLTLVDEKRRELMAIEAAAFDAMAGFFRALLAEAERYLAPLLAAIQAAIDEGNPMTSAQLVRDESFRRFTRQLDAQLSAFTPIATAAVTQAQIDSLALLDPLALIRAALGESPLGRGIDVRVFALAAILGMIGDAGDGNPLSQLLAANSAATATAVHDAIVRGVAAGSGTAPIAAEVRSALGISMLRASTIARTETHRLYREGTRQAVIANHELLEGWVWRAAKDRRTCPVCWAMDGTLFEFTRGTIDSRRVVDIPLLESHPNCRCAMVPRAKSYGDILGDPSLPDRRAPIRSGEEAFAALPYETQREILGPGHHDLYRAGVPLSEMVKRVDAGSFGPSRQVRPIRDIPTPAAAKASDTEMRALVDRRRELGVTTSAIARQLRVNTLVVARLEAGRGTAADQLRYRIALDRLTHGKAGSLTRVA